MVGDSAAARSAGPSAWARGARDVPATGNRSDSESLADFAIPTRKITCTPAEPIDSKIGAWDRDDCEARIRKLGR